MARAKRICPKPGCPQAAVKRYCPTHEREYEQQRGTREQRGYGSLHVKARSALAPRVATGSVCCARCGNPILPGESWHLDHDDNDRTKYIGPSHERCNLSAAGKASHQYA